MGKRNSSDHNGGPNNKRTKLNGHQIIENTTRTASSLCKESPKLEFQLSREIVNGTIITDKLNKKWRIGKPIGKGSFGEIFLASDDVYNPVTSENAKYVVKIEPHSNGPLFVEIHCLLNTARNSEDNPLPPGMPEFIASGSHYFKNTRYRFLIIKRFDRDLHSIIKNRRVDTKSVLILAVQILDVLQHLHDKGYCHSDIKAENLMISRCTFCKCSKSVETSCDEGISLASEDKYDEDEHISNDDEDNDEEFKTPIKKRSIQYSGSNPVRSCRLNKRSSTYQDLLKTHYLRPTKKVNYSEFFCDDNSKSSEDDTIDDYLSRHKLSTENITQTWNKERSRSYWYTEDRIILIDFGLASKFIYSNESHRPFCMDQRRAHDGTLEFTSRDAHMGAHSRRSDLECLGYNLIFWSQGYLPWKEYAAQNLPEKVHWMKEYLMTDVKEMLKVIYGKSVPKFLGDYMHYVGTLAYDERPNYDKCKRIFEREFEKLGYKKTKMVLDVNELIKNSIDIKEERENNNVFEMKNIKSIMKNLGILMPFRESNSNRVSPKNLRSTSEKQSNKRRKFSWAEVIAQDPDQIARERAEKEFEREQSIETPTNRYNGKPTYAIVEIENKIKFKDRLERYTEPEHDALHIKGYTKQMMTVLKKSQSSLINQLNDDKKQQNDLGITNKKLPSSNNRIARARSKPGLRTMITATRRALDYNQEIIERRAKRSHKNSGDFTADESSCSSINSISSSSNSNKNSRINSSIQGTTSCSSCVSSGLISDEDSRDVITGFNAKKSRIPTPKAPEPINNVTTPMATTTATTTPIVNKRKRRTPRKRNCKGVIS